ncbi:hypothetical protein MC885_000872 [Smutsia gigantea]|nr:hypothetical protein MC885_000872 [Smutsia gigantea]
MLLRKRCGRGPCRLQFLLLFLVLGFLLLTVTVLHTPPQAPLQAGTAQAAGRSLEPGFRLDFGESQEWVLKAEDDGQEYGPLEDLPPFISLREDQLLVAMVSPWTRRNQSQGKRGGGYRLIKQPSSSQDKGAPVRDWGAEEDSEVSEEEELTSRRLEEALSARIPLKRALPEVRHPLPDLEVSAPKVSLTSYRPDGLDIGIFTECRNLALRCVQQQPQGSLPTASVILCFHEEAWSTLLRTVHSILDTVPRAFLKEIILVDDLSRPGQLKSALSAYVARLDGVKLLRSTKRLGAIRARMLGAARATGDVLVFMDSHCECQPGWLEPLLGRIADDRNRVVSPVIDVIDWKTFQYYPSRDLQRGVLDWKLDFHWEPLPEGERKALQSPVVPSGVVAMDRHYFQNTGAYDPLMLLQGGENLELSLKAWLCGGSVEILPCSRVGHVYRNPDASSPLDQEAALWNKVRIAEAWLGSFKDTFYRHNPEALSLSKLHNTALGFCADCQAAGDILGCAMTLAPCSDSRRQQHLEHAGRQGIHFGSPQHLCFDVRQEQVILQPCAREGPGIHQQLWDFQENGMIVHILSGKCLEAVEQENRNDLYLRQCDGKGSQLWRFDKVQAVTDR